mgnify:FL=1
MSRRVDWSVPQHCGDCGSPLRPGHAPIEDWPGTRAHHARGLCMRGFNVRRVAARREREGIKPRPKPRRNPTVAELAAQGHPCIEPAPMPSRVRTYPL